LSLLAGVSGYATYNDIGGHGMEDVHEALANTLLALVFVHIAGVVLSSLLHRENLARSMVNGYKSGKAGEGIRYRHRVIGAALVAAVLGLWIAGPDSLPGASASTERAAAAVKYHSANRSDD
jgi:hypothetical protein